MVVFQVHANAVSGADVGQRALRGTGEMQVVAEGVFDALQRHRAVVWHFTEVEKQVVQRLQEVVAALGAHQVHLLVRVVDALARLLGDERDLTALVVGEGTGVERGHSMESGRAIRSRIHRGSDWGF
ncbi:hypothetical protein D3C77_314270 [compost metagenome]